MWEKRLQGYSHKEFIVSVIEDGYRFIDNKEVIPSFDCKNYESFEEERVEVARILGEEVEKGWIVPWEGDSLPRWISARGAVPKPDSVEKRLIHDLSRPLGRAVNDFVEVKHFFMDTVDLVASWMTPGCLFFKVDIRHAYRNIPIHPDNWELLAFRWDKGVWIDTRLVFGLSTAPEVWTRFSGAVVWILRKEGEDRIAVYIDDYCGVAATQEEADRKMRRLIELLEELGLPVNWKPGKVIPPCRQIKFLGVLLDSEKMMASIPEEKLLKIKREVKEFLGKSKATVREVQRLVGRLNFACKVVRGGRTFLRRMIDVMGGKPSHHHIRISEEFKQDLVWWDSFLDTWNGREVVFDGSIISVVSLQIDASTSFGAGAFFEGEHISYQWQKIREHINVLEVYPMLLAAKKWGERWKGKVILVQSDNMAAVQAFQKGSSKNKRVMKWLRKLFWLSAKGNFEVKAVHIEGKANVLADLLSRGKMEEFIEKRGKWLRARQGERGQLFEEEPWLTRLWEFDEAAKQKFKERKGIGGSFVCGNSEIDHLPS